MRTLMLAWEFPPMKSGGLGVVCYHLTKELGELGVDIIYLLPKIPENLRHEFEKLISANYPRNKVKFYELDIKLYPYLRLEDSELKVYFSYTSENLEKYKRLACKIAELEHFDVIHCHDWMTFPAGVELKYKFGKPLVLHVHSTSYDRCGGNLNRELLDYKIEKYGFAHADKIIAVSRRIKNIIVNFYDVPPEKVEVVYNAAILRERIRELHLEKLKRYKIVLFLGRLTLHKGPDWFLRAAHKVLQFEPNVLFIVGGSGEMMPQLIKLSADLGIGDKVIFTGALSDREVDALYELADVYVMPSLSEPFGITPLEALYHDKPVIISKQAGVSEVLRNVFQVDFWDVDEMVNKIVALLRYPKLAEELVRVGKEEASYLSWRKSAEQVLEVYRLLTA